MKDRNPYDLTKVKEDRCDLRLQYLLNLINLYFKNNIHIFFFSGREGTEQCYTDTFEWLSKYIDFPITLFMRNEGDYRPDEIIKIELYNKVIKDKYNVLCVFDDRDKVVKAWRELGLLTLQVYYGNF